MNPLDFNEVREYVNNNIDSFHQRRIRILGDLELESLIKKNPYLFRAKAIEKAQDLIEGLLDAYLSSSEEELFGEFLEDLAVFVAEKTTGGKKSAAEGIDLSFERDNITYLVAIKSGTNWGNSQQQKRLEDDLRRAKRVLRQSERTRQVETILGICYGNTKTKELRGYTKYVGQEFWKLISDSDTLYMDIIEPIGYRAKEHNEEFERQKVITINRLNKRFMDEFCDDDGFILWKKLVFFVSNNEEKEKLPYGYYYDYDGIHINEEQANIVRLIFQLRENHPENERPPSMNSIAEHLNQQGQKNWVGNKWNSSNITKIIHARVYYTGTNVNGDEKLPSIL